MNLSIQTFSNLSPQEIFAIFQARQKVFVLEQACLYPDIDNIDLQAWHIQGTTSQRTRVLNSSNNSSNNSANILLAYARVYFQNVKLADNLMTCCIGRVLVLPKFRQQGLAYQLMLFTIEQAKLLIQSQSIPMINKDFIYISAQTYLIDFYCSLGFVVKGLPYLEDGIEHVDMYLSITG